MSTGYQQPNQIARRLKPEEEELYRKREELASVRASLAERELELVDFRSQLAEFEGRYLRQVGTLYAELDEWTARILELQADRDPSVGATARAKEAREHARHTYEDAHGAVSKTPTHDESPELKSLFREVAKRVHPDFSRGSDDMACRTRLMAEANRAYQAGDIEVLRRILDDYQDSEAAAEGEGIGSELIRLIREISLARDRIVSIDHELATLRRSETALLRNQARESEQEDGDFLADLESAVRQQIDVRRKQYEALSKKEGKAK